MVVHLLTVGGVWIKSFILLLNGRVNSSICVWVVQSFSNPGIRDEKRCLRILKRSDLRTVIPARKEYLPSVFYKVFCLIC